MALRRELEEARATEAQLQRVLAPWMDFWEGGGARLGSLGLFRVYCLFKLYGVVLPGWEVGLNFQ